MEPPENQPPPSYLPQQPAPAPVLEQPVAPPPQYAPPPYGAQPMAPPTAPRRGRGGLIAIVAIVLVVLLAAGGYLVGGFLVAQGQLNSATNTYNGVADHQNALNDFLKTLGSKINAVNINDATHDNVNAAKTLYQQLVTQSQSSEPQVDSDMASLDSAQAKLGANSWLTGLSKSSLDKESTRIGYVKSALGVAKTILTDYVQYGTFNQALLDAVNDLLTITDTANQKYLAGASAAVVKLKADIATAIGEDHAPGLPTETDAFMHDFQSLANHFGDLLKAAAAGDSIGVQKADSELNADLTRINAYDQTTMDTESTTFYNNLIDQYNGFIDKANNG